MPEPRRPDTGGESSECAREARANDWLDLGASTGDDPRMNSRVDGKEQLNVWLTSDLRVQASNDPDRVSPILLVILDPDFESTAPMRQKPETLPAKSTRSGSADRGSPAR